MSFVGAIIDRPLRVRSLSAAYGTMCLNRPLQVVVR